MQKRLTFCPVNDSNFLLPTQGLITEKSVKAFQEIFPPKSLNV